MDRAFDLVKTTDSLHDVDQLLAHDALWVDVRGEANQAVPLTPSEIASLRTFAATGRRLVLIGEYSPWTPWTDSLIEVASTGEASSGPSTGNEILAVVLDHPTTRGVNSVATARGGTVLGDEAVSLFDQSVATLWGSELNLLLQLDSNIFDSVRWDLGDNSVYGENVVAWLAPEPAIPGLLLLALTAGLWRIRS